MIGLVLFSACALLLYFLIEHIFKMVSTANTEVPVTRYMEPRHTYRIAIDNPSCYGIASRISKEFSSNTEVIMFTGSAGEIASALEERTIDVAIVSSTADMPQLGDYDVMYTECSSEPIDIAGSDVHLEPLSHQIRSFRIIYRSPLVQVVEKAGIVPTASKLAV
ncbi:MAG: hypothetical protein SOI44_01860 [Lactimicrobium sp.]|jgi:hypothetical protein|uniref:hypothetical protein n=1 Tax=Lactimicrobium sp. TaxID=2563780 RepID=UPI002F35B443